MKNFIILLAFMAIAVDGQLRSDPYSSYVPNTYNIRQNPQPSFQPYVPYQPSITNRRRYYSPAVSTAVPTTFLPYISSTTSPQSYNPFATQTISRRPYISTAATQAPTIVPQYNSPYVAPQSYRPFQTFTATRRPYIVSTSTPTPATVATYTTPYVVPESKNLYQTSTTTNRPYTAIVTTAAPTTAPLYNTQNLVSQSYRPYQTSTTTIRPYIPFVTTPAPTTAPLYNTQYVSAQSYRPYQTSTTLRPYIPIAPSTLQPYIPPSFIVPTATYNNGDARTANTLRSGNEINPDGRYNWFFETDNGIAAQAQGTPKNFGGDPPFVGEEVQGAFSWTAPNGEFIDFTYTADENGYHPKSNAIPTPPPVPPQIVRLLEYLSRVAGAKK